MSDGPNANFEVNLDGMQQRLAGLYQQAQTLNPDTNPTEVVGLITGALSALSFVFIDTAKSLRRIAIAQERLVAIAEADLSEIVNDAIKEGVDKGVEERLSTRSFIGKPPASQS